jgi:hypothetical protein
MQHADGHDELLRMQQARLQKGHKGFPFLKERLPGMRSWHQDWTGWDEKGRRDILRMKSKK